MIFIMNSNIHDIVYTYVLTCVICSNVFLTTNSFSKGEKVVLSCCKVSIASLK